jgi:hypothetical protein
VSALVELDISTVLAFASFVFSLVLLFSLVFEPLRSSTNSVHCCLVSIIYKMCIIDV